MQFLPIDQLSTEHDEEKANERRRGRGRERRREGKRESEKGKASSRAMGLLDDNPLTDQVFARN
jgi:hypothetical protein